MESNTSKVTYTVEMLGLNDEYSRILSDKVGNDVKSLQSMDIAQISSTLKCDLNIATQVKGVISTTVQSLTFMMPRKAIIRVFSNAWMQGMVRSYETNSQTSTRIERIKRELGQ